MSHSGTSTLPITAAGGVIGHELMPTVFTAVTLVVVGLVLIGATTVRFTFRRNRTHAEV